MKKTPSTAVSEFAQLAADFCAWCESDSLGTEPERTFSDWFAKLYAGGLRLSEVQAEADAPKSIDLNTAQAETAINKLLGHHYWEIFDPNPMLREEPVVGDVGDDLLDVYRDVKRGLEIYRVGFPLAAEWEWAFNFRTHWGRHAAAALLALHGLVISSSSGEQAAS
jgi:hypothetical protein